MIDQRGSSLVGSGRAAWWLRRGEERMKPELHLRGRLAQQPPQRSPRRGLRSPLVGDRPDLGPHPPAGDHAAGAARAPPPPRGTMKRKANQLQRALKLIGPGFITGASDDDPSGIGTYAVAGA